jgi:hypothetical protein
VRIPRVYALPFRSPQIAEVYREPPLAGIRSGVVEVGETLRIRGMNLRATPTRVRLGPENLLIAEPQTDQIDVVVPATLPAGTHAVQVLHDLLLEGAEGAPPVPHRGFSSNLLACLVIPRLTAVNPATAGPGATVTVTVDPPRRATQEAVLLLNDFALPAVPLPAAAPPSATVQFRLPSGAAALPAGSYLMRLRIEGAESRLAVNPATGDYTGPLYPVTA